MKKVLKFQELSENNKTQFLQLLLKNQSIKKSKTISSCTPTKNRSKNKPILNAIDSNIINHTPTKQIRYYPKTNHYSPDVSHLSKLSQKNNQNRLSNKQPARKNKKFKANISDIQNNIQRSHQLSDRLYPERQTPTQSIFIQRKLKKIKSPSKQTIVDKTFDDKNINIVLVNYLKCFELSMIGIKPLKWSLYQFGKVTEQIYSEVFLRLSYLSRKNTYRNQINCNLNKQEQGKQLTPFHEIIMDFYLNKYRNAKLSKFHIINMIYALSYYQHQQIDKISKLSLQIFSKFITNYDSQLLIFFLCSRNMLQKTFGVSFINYWQKKPTQYINQNFILNQKKLITFLKVVLEGQNHLITKYKDIIFMNNTIREVHFYEILDKLMQDFIDKKMSEDYMIQQDTEELFSTPQTHLPIKKDNSYQQSSSNIFKNKIIFQEIKQQTFQNNQFWKCINTEQIELQGELQKIIMLKLQKKLQILIDIVANDYSKEQKNKLFYIIFKKAKNLMHLIFVMNTTGWFQQIGIRKPWKKDLQLIENLHQQITDIKMDYSDSNDKIDKKISALCKNILTIDVFTKQLQKIIVCQPD